MAKILPFPGTSVALLESVTNENTARIENLAPVRTAPSRRLSVVREDDAHQRFAGMISADRGMSALFAAIKKVAVAKAPVLVYGASGTGKELIARALHDESSRANRPFLAINCGALAASIIESELFGHVKGAFTGALADKAGAFEAVDGGTLFLDEIGEMPLELQPKLLRALESMSVRRVGGTEEISIDVRVVAATHRNLAKLVSEGRFREDLFHRLCVLSLRVPSLAERPGDIKLLARWFLRQEGSGLELSRGAEDCLADHNWPGNIRELKNVITRAAVLAEGQVIDADAIVLSDSIFEDKRVAPARIAASGSYPSLREELEAVELQRIQEALAIHATQAEAAEALGVPIRTFFNRLDALGIARPRKSKV